MRIELSSKTRSSYTSSREREARHNIFFAEAVDLPAGWFRARIQVLFSQFADGEEINLRIKEVATRSIVAETTLIADPKHPELGDENYLEFQLKRAGHIEVTGSVARNCTTTLLRMVTIIDDTEHASTREAFFYPDEPPPTIADLHEVLLGTTGVCNASCVHCPTNKRGFPMPHGRMSDELFYKIMSELKEGSFKGNFFFGLFAEPLADPNFIERMKFLRSEFPRSSIFMSTNAALFDPGKHSDLFKYVHSTSVHVEALDPEIYDELMHPLKADRVIPKVHAMADAFRRTRDGNLVLTTPIHKRNLSELRALTMFAREIGIGVSFSGFSNRAWDEGPYSKLTIAPVGGLCRPNVLTNSVFIDFDGLVVPCCFDFSRSLPLGDLKKQSFQEVFQGEQWQSLYGTFKRGEWSSRAACARCRVDDASTVESLARQLSASTEGSLVEVAPYEFQLTQLAYRRDDGAALAPFEGAEGFVVYGPYVNLPRGRYIAYHLIEITDVNEGASLNLDVCANYKEVIASRQISVDEAGRHEASIEFKLATDAIVELRIARLGRVGFVHEGATIVKGWAIGYDRSK